MPGATVERCFQYRGDGDPDVRAGDWFHIECKVGRKMTIGSAIKQAVDDSDVAERLMPIVVAKVDYTEPYVALRLNDFGRLVSALWASPEAQKKLSLREPPEEP